MQVNKKVLYVVLGGAIMILGDYLVSYYNPIYIFIVGEIVSLFGWSLFVLALDNN